MWHTRETDLPKGFQVLVDTHPEYGKTPQRETDRNVVYDGDVQVAASSAKVAFVVGTSSFHDQTGKCKERLDLDIFYSVVECQHKGNEEWRCNPT